PALPPPEGGALSPELWGLCDTKGYQPHAMRGHAAPRCAQRPKDATLTDVTHGLGRVLVVDDDEVIRRLIAVNLQLEGFEVETAVDGQDCLDRVTEMPRDVITLH